MARRAGKPRDPAKEQFWRRVIRRQQRSGLGIRDFCRGEGLKVCTFRWWRQELKRRDRQPIPAVRDGCEADSPDALPEFLPVRVIDLEPVASRPIPPIEVVLPSGPLLRVPAGFDPQALGAVLSVLEGRPC